MRLAIAEHKDATYSHAFMNRNVQASIDTADPRPSRALQQARGHLFGFNKATRHNKQYLQVQADMLV